MKKHNILVTIFILIMLILSSCTQMGDTQNNTDIPKNDNDSSKVDNVVNLTLECAQNGGTWIEEFRECEYIGNDWCDDNGGNFKECTSACRNNPEAEICTMQCVPVCQFEGEKTKEIKLDEVLLNNETASKLVEEEFGNCNERDCDSLDIKVLENSEGKGKIEVIYNGLKDDSLNSIKIIYKVSYENNKWILGEELKKEFKCQKGRGQEDFAENFCN